MQRAARFEFDSQTPSDFGSWSMDRQPIARILQAHCVDSLVGPLRQGFLVAPHFEGKVPPGISTSSVTCPVLDQPHFS